MAAKMFQSLMELQWLLMLLLLPLMRMVVGVVEGLMVMALILFFFLIGFCDLVYLVGIQRLLLWILLKTTFLLQQRSSFLFFFLVSFLFIFVSWVHLFSKFA